MKKLNNIFYFSYFLIIFSDMYNDVSYLKNILQFFDIISLSMIAGYIVINFIYNKKIKIKYFLYIIFLIFVLVSSFVANDRSLIKLAFLLMAMETIDFNQLIKKDLKIRSFLLLVLMILCVVGIVDAEVIEFRNGLPRYNFGMAHPNSFAFELTIIYFDYLYLKSLKTKKIDLMAFLLAVTFIIFIYLFVGSRTNMLVIMLILIGYVFKQKLNLKNKIFNLILQNSFLIFLILSIICSYFYPNDLLLKLDGLFSRRLYLANYYINTYGLKILGSDIFCDQYFVLDNAYINLLVRFGLLTTIILSMLYVLNFKLILKHNNKMLLIIMLVLMIYGLFETPMYIPGKCPYILSLSYMLNLKGDEKNEK